MTNLMQASAWHGVWTAIVTPLTPSLELDEAGLQSLMESQIADSIAGFVVAGSTGEGSLLSLAVYARLLERAVAIAKARVPIVAGLGIGGTRATLEIAAVAKAAGVQGFLASPPAYVKAPQRGLEAHFLKIAKEGGLPLCLYEVPGRAASSLATDTVARIFHAAGGGVVAIKDASNDLSRVSALRRQVGGGMAILSGEDGSFAGFVAAGGDGIVSVSSHVVPQAMRRILKLGRSGDNPGAEREQLRIAPLVDELFREANPIPVKSWLARAGLIGSAHFCPPLVPMREELLATLAREADLARQGEKA